MKKILIGALMVITSYGAQSQHIIEVPLSTIPTNEEVKLVDEVSGVQIQLQVTPSKDTLGLPPHAVHHPPMMRGNFPKPEQIIRKGNKVILIFDRKQFDKFRRWDLLKNKRRLETGTEWQKRVGHSSTQRGYLGRNPNGQ